MEALPYWMIFDLFRIWKLAHVGYFVCSCYFQCSIWQNLLLIFQHCWHNNFCALPSPCVVSWSRLNLGSQKSRKFCWLRKTDLWNHSQFPICSSRENVFFSFILLDNLQCNSLALKLAVVTLHLTFHVQIFKFSDVTVHTWIGWWRQNVL